MHEFPPHPSHSLKIHVVRTRTSWHAILSVETQDEYLVGVIKDRGKAMVEFNFNACSAVH